MEWNETCCSHIVLKSAGHCKVTAVPMSQLLLDQGLNDYPITSSQLEIFPRIAHLWYSVQDCRLSPMQSSLSSRSLFLSFHYISLCGHVLATSSFLLLSVAPWISLENKGRAPGSERVHISKNTLYCINFKPCWFTEVTVTILSICSRPWARSWVPLSQSWFMPTKNSLGMTEIRRYLRSSSVPTTPERKRQPTY